MSVHADIPLVRRVADDLRDMLGDEFDEQTFFDSLDGETDILDVSDYVLASMFDDEALAEALNTVKGLEAKPMGRGGGTVAAFFRQTGLPAAVWITAQDTAHQPNEHCLISDIITDAKVFASVFMGQPFEEKL